MAHCPDPPGDLVPDTWGAIQFHSRRRYPPREQGVLEGAGDLDGVGSPPSFVWMHARCGERLPLGRTYSLGYGPVGPVLQVCRRIGPHGG